MKTPILHIFVFFSLILFVPLKLICQNWNELDSIVIKRYNEGNYASAVNYAEKALKQAEKEFGKKNNNYVSSLHNLALLYSIIGQYEKAEPYYLKALKISKDVFGEKHPDYASGLNNLAVLYVDMGQYEKAEPYYLQAMKIRKEVFGENNPVYASSLNNLAVLYENLGKYEESELFYLQALKIRKEVLGEKHPDYAISLNNLAGLYENLGQYEKAEIFYLQALRIHKVVLGEKHPDYATSLNNLGYLYSKMYQYNKAELFYLRALKIDKETLGENHPDYATDLDNLAVLYDDIGQYKKAETCFYQALKIRKKVLGEKHSLYASSLNNLAILYDDMGQYEKAEHCFLQALKIRKEVLGEKHPDYAKSLNNLGYLYSSIGKYEKAEPLLIEANKLLLEQLFSSFGFMSEKEQQQYFNTYSYNFKKYNSFIFNRKIENPKVASFSFNNELVLKSALLNSSKQMYLAVLNSGDTSLINMFTRWQSLKQQLVRQYQLPINKRYNVDTLEEQTNKLEKELTKNSQSFRNINASLLYTYDSIRNYLKNNEVAIEFTSFQYYNGKRLTDSTYYCALVLKKDYEYPKMIFLTEERSLINLLQKGKNSKDYEWVNNIYDYKRGGIRLVNNNFDSTYSGQELYNLIWAPIDSLLEGVKTVWFSPSGLLYKVSFAAIPDPSGLLYKVSFAAIPDPSGKRLIDKYQLNCVSSTRQIITGEPPAPLFTSNTTAAFYGGINYDWSVNQKHYIQQDTNSDLVTTYNPGSRYIPNDSSRSSSFIYLKGTLEEVNKLDSLTTQNKIKSQLFTGNDATESIFKENTGKKSPVILHIATHGFFFPEPAKDYNKMNSNLAGDNNFRYSGDPLLRSGLALAGANQKWLGNEIPENAEDGILTAKEVANLYLPNTKMVVLSACETGLGDIKGSEGVFGLQRAFKMAGVQYIIMSLWQVPDKQTVELMELFYTNCINGIPVRQAFSQAQQAMKKNYPDQPYYWAAFVLVE